MGGPPPQGAFPPQPHSNMPPPGGPGGPGGMHWGAPPGMGGPPPPGMGGPPPGMLHPHSASMGPPPGAPAPPTIPEKEPYNLLSFPAGLIPKLTRNHLKCVHLGLSMCTMHVHHTTRGVCSRPPEGTAISCTFTRIRASEYWARESSGPSLHSQQLGNGEGWLQV